MSFFNTADYSWHEPPGHTRGFSQYLINPDNSSSRNLDFRVSRYPPQGRVDLHEHATAEHVYLIISGLGVAELGDESGELGPGTFFFVPPGVPHSVTSTGPDDLVFVLVTSPPDLPR
jgi:mannose-6-phosphate isomerase-like protein (cupin superfamily)